MRHTRNNTRRERRGTAMIEFVLSIPLLALVIAGVFFFGMVMRNQQRLRAADRYAVWRSVHNGQAEADASDQAYFEYGEPDEAADRAAFIRAYEAVNVVDPTADRINELFLADRGESVTVESGGGLAATREELIDAAATHGSDAGDLAREAVGDFPGGSSVLVDADFPHESAALDRIEASMDSPSGSHGGNVSAAWRTYYREGVTWRRWQVSYLEPIRDLFLSDLHAAVQGLGVEQLRQNLEDLYLLRW